MASSTPFSFDWSDSLINVNHRVDLRKGYYTSDLNTYCANNSVQCTDTTVIYGLAHDRLFNILSTVKSATISICVKVCTLFWGELVVYKQSP